MKTPLRTPLSRGVRQRIDSRTTSPAGRLGSGSADPRSRYVGANGRPRRSQPDLRANLRRRDIDSLRREYRAAVLRRKRAERTKARVTRGKLDFKTRRRLRYRLRRAGALFVLLVGAALVFYAYTSLSSAGAPQRLEVPERVEPPEPPAPARVPADLRGDTDEGWSAAVALDPSPSLAAPGESTRFERRVALTFDDGPDPDVTPAVLDTLRERGVKATFFVEGENVAEHPEVVRRIVREGHTLGNHTYTHADLSALSSEQVREELRATQEAVDRALGYRYPMTLMRPPYGEPYFRNADALPAFEAAMRDERMYPVLWTMDSNDSLQDARRASIVKSVAEAKIVLDREENDGVLLLHDTQLATVEALPLVISYYELAGLEFTGVRELLADKYGVEPGEIQSDPPQR